jgi:uncharacterized protein
VSGLPTAYVIFPDGSRVEAAVAETDAARARGLMFRGPLTDAEGMLFVFARADRYGFWMQNVRAPLDIIWLDGRGRVVGMVENAPPCDTPPCPTFVPATPALFVVEVAGGFVRRHGISAGDVVTIQRER